MGLPVRDKKDCNRHQVWYSKSATELMVLSRHPSLRPVSVAPWQM